MQVLQQYQGVTGELKNVLDYFGNYILSNEIIFLKVVCIYNDALKK